jgi:putative aldouronate transport system substrate-binding protein
LLPAVKGGDTKPSGGTNDVSQSQSQDASDKGGNTGEGMVAKGESLPILPEPKTYTAMVIQTSALKAAEETNISFDWSEVPSSGWTERINILFNTDSIPDVIIGDAGVSQNYEQLLTLDDYIDDYAPNVKAFLEERPEYNAALRAPDGKIHSFPIGDEAYSNKVDAKMWINTEWLDKLGLEMPTTIDWP